MPDVPEPRATNGVIADTRLIELPDHVSSSGELLVMQGQGLVPFQIGRVFLVRAPVRATRGKHAHKRCNQFMVCTVGSVEMHCDDGTNTADFTLDSWRTGLLVPAGVWASQTYLEPGSTLLVLCDRPYESDDYIRDYTQFKEYRAGA